MACFIISFSLLGNLIKFYDEMTSSIVVESILNTNLNRSYLPFVFAKAHPRMDSGNVLPYTMKYILRRKILVNPPPEPTTMLLLLSSSSTTTKERR